MRRALAAWPVALLASVGCARSSPFAGPLRLLEQPTVAGALAKSGALTTGDETRPALLESARYRVALPARAKLTFGMGLAYAGSGEAPGWYRLTVLANDTQLLERQLNPRAAHGFRDVSLPLTGGSGQTELRFELRLTDRDGREIPAPKELLIGVADPVVHDLDDYGKSKGVVLISIDTLRRDHVGAYGYTRPTTPRLDALAREGLLAQDAVSTSSWTLPAHLSLLTSADPGVHGGVDHKHRFDGRLATLPGALRKAGYATHAITSHLYVSRTYGLDAGFDHLDFHQDRKATETADKAIALLERIGDRPFFLFLHFYDPHWHYDPPEKFRALFATGYQGPQTGLWQSFKEKTRATTKPEELRHLLALYDGEIRYTDDEVGRILDHLGASGLSRSTLVAVTSDHGDEFLEHGSWEHQKTLYEEVIRVPLIVHGPGIAARVEKAQASLLDVAPTILAWAGLPPLPAAQGRSLLAPIGGEREAYGETDHTTDGTRKLFLRAGEGRWKGVLSLDETGSQIRRQEWFDLARDPLETREARPRDDVAEAIAARARQRWRDGRGRGLGATVQLTPEQKEQLRALGYIK
jgi:arylsulfatase A-like enzyme